MHLLKLIPLSLFGIASLSHATLVNEKIILKPSMEVHYKLLPSSVDTVSEIFSEGMFYGRLRSNMFLWDYKSKSEFDHKALGVGGSFIYKTAPYSGVSTTVGLYTSQNPAWFRESSDDVGKIKSGKDTFSRSATDTSGNFGMSVLGQAYLQYDIAKTSIKAGRQMFESVYTRSNDTKMVPNTFDGLTATIQEIPDTTIKLAYLDKQKLRDHTSGHDVIAYSGWTENDDAGVNKNLTVALIGDDNELIMATLRNKSIKNLQADINYFIISDVISNLTLESHYKIAISKDWSLIPGFRYMQQFDNLHTNTNVASLKDDAMVGYTNKTSLDTNLLALRLDIKSNAFLARLGYSKIADKADIVAPWRGFPTGGFTRAMAQYNWYANTKTYMIRAGYDFDKANIIDGFSIMARYAIQDFDNNKDGIKFTDSNVIHIDLMQNIGKNLQAKIRMGFVDADDSVVKSDGTFKDDLSYNEYRFELNYFF